MPQIDNVLAVFGEVAGAGFTTEIDRPAADIPVRARSADLEGNPTHGTIGALPDRGVRLRNDVSRPADHAQSSAPLAAFECLVDRLPEVWLGL